MPSLYFLKASVVKSYKHLCTNPAHIPLKQSTYGHSLQGYRDNCIKHTLHGIIKKVFASFGWNNRTIYTFHNYLVSTINISHNLWFHCPASNLDHIRKTSRYEASTATSDAANHDFHITLRTYTSMASLFLMRESVSGLRGSSFSS